MIIHVIVAECMSKDNDVMTQNLTKRYEEKKGNTHQYWMRSRNKDSTISRWCNRTILVCDWTIYCKKSSSYWFICVVAEISDIIQILGFSRFGRSKVERRKCRLKSKVAQKLLKTRRFSRAV